ncbi:response regulator [Conexibacter woesei]|uniref:Two component transcriptional regulator, LuxR family n=1 Tax=Conexibacter woesei (strain DSM 14684 / CCUG 47730 / CIP 108061 / JCM 11494 / NBRC 100937 / ID131577) TaxID=469383 RepID=D3F521_CONWI|nr:response regulator transcription factor [Conexibacter woesei]ADB48599.1 two component transcriptional regulator, LuxR family [Conexibacter woesei DSM 14684]
MNIRVLVVEDFPLVRDGVVDALSRDPGIEVVGAAVDGREGLALAHELRPDVIVLDLHMPEIGGMMVLERLRTELPSAKSIVMTATEKAEPLLDAIAAGAAGYLTKRTSGEELRQAILTVHGGGSVIAPQLAPHLLQAYSRASTGEAPDVRKKLTATEHEVLRLVAQGMTDRQIAERLFVSPRTVQNHLARIREKTSMRRRSDLARWAVLHAVY